MPSLEFVQVLFYLLGTQNLEFLILPDHSHLDVRAVHLPFKVFLQGHQSGMDRVFNLHVIFISLLQKCLCVFGPFSDSCGLPVIVGS